MSGYFVIRFTAVPEHAFIRPVDGYNENGWLNTNLGYIALLYFVHMDHESMLPLLGRVYMLYRDGIVGSGLKKGG